MMIRQNLSIDIATISTVLSVYMYVIVVAHNTTVMIILSYTEQYLMLLACHCRLEVIIIHADTSNYCRLILYYSLWVLWLS